ncbi:MAG: hypothetical protein NTW86_22285 [Candidatus Sumerlaeota bacterium]|nr:hypothetical protein [Candidatus Sumerlaeota bacterium]
MPPNPDYKELFSILNEEAVEFLVVGAHAVMFYTAPRYTKDLDIWVNPTPDNSRRVFAVLKRFGAPLAGIVPDDFTDPGLVYQVGIEPNRFDVVMGIAGLEFEAAWRGRQASAYEGVPISILGKPELILAKKAAGRRQDLLDLEKLCE